MQESRFNYPIFRPSSLVLLHFPVE